MKVDGRTSSVEFFSQRESKRIRCQPNSPKFMAITRIFSKKNILKNTRQKHTPFQTPSFRNKKEQLWGCWAFHHRSTYGSPFFIAVALENSCPTLKKNKTKTNKFFSPGFLHGNLGYPPKATPPINKALLRDY